MIHQKVNWLTRLRWAAIVGQAATIFAAHTFLGIKLPLVSLGAVLGLEVLANLAIQLVLARRKSPVSDREVFGLITVDLVFLTVLLYFSGGPSNPFNFLYLVYVVLAAVLVGARSAIYLTGISALLFSALFVPHYMHRDLHIHSMMDWHLEGMWVAFVIAAVFIVYFLGRIDAEVNAQRDALARARVHAERHERLSSLATLVAGAAHELGTPLSTIALVSSELVRRLERAPDADPRMREDAEILRAEVERCRSIIERMAESSGNARGENAVEFHVQGFVRDTLEQIGPPERVDVHYAPGMENVSVIAPRNGLELALRAIVKNALDASPLGERPLLSVASDRGLLQMQVEDHGPGISESDLPRVVEPFYTTKAPGKGMGLGLFLADNVMRQLGGRLVLERGHEGTGTIARLEFPTASFGTSAKESAS